MDSPEQERRLSKEVSFKDAETGEISRPGTGTDVLFRPGSRPTPGVAAQVMEPDSTTTQHNRRSQGEESQTETELVESELARGVDELAAGRVDADRKAELLVVDDRTFDEITQEESNDQPRPAQADSEPPILDAGAGALNRSNIEHQADQCGSDRVGREPSQGAVDSMGFGRVTSAPGPRSVGTPAVVAEMALVRVLRFVSTFSQLDVGELRELARRGLTIKFRPGETIVEQGETGDSLFVVFSGTVRLQTDLGELGTPAAQGNQTLVLSRGHVFGESALVWGEEGRGLRLNEGREWRVKALTASVLLELPREVALPPLQEKDPLTVEALAERHRQARAATRVQRFVRRIRMNKTQKQRLIDMLAKAARDMVAELKNLSPHARAYMAIRQSLSHDYQQAAKPSELAVESPPASAQTPAEPAEKSWTELEELPEDEEAEEWGEGEEVEEAAAVTKLVVVSVVQCMGLPERAGVVGKAGREVDGRCECALGDKKYPSEVVFASCDPFWNAAFAFPQPEKEEGGEGDGAPAAMVQLEVWDERLQGRWQGAQRRVLLGRAQVPAKVGHGWLELEAGEAGVEGMAIEVGVRKFELAEKSAGATGKARKGWRSGLAPSGPGSPSRFEVRGAIQSERAKQRKQAVAHKVVERMAVEAAKPPPPPPSKLLHPDSEFRQLLDAAALLASLASLFLAPLSACFGIGRTEGEWLVLLSTLCDVVGMAHVHFRLRSMFLFREEGDAHWRTEPRWARCVDLYLNTPGIHAAAVHVEQVLVAVGVFSPRRKSYRQSPWLAWWGGGDPLPAVTVPAKGEFWLDAVAAAPAELLLVSARGGGGGWHAFLRAVQVGKVLVVARIRGKVLGVQEARPQLFALLTTGRLVLYALLLVHWVACLWFLALRVSHHVEDWVPSDSACEDRSILLDPETHSAWRYVCAWYWTVQTAAGVGYGDIPLLTSGERLLAMVVMVGGVAVSVVAVSSLLGWVQDAPDKQAAFAKSVGRLTAYLRMRRLPKRLQRRVEAFYEDDWAWREGQSDLEVLAPLPLSLRVRALMGMHGALFRNVPFFSEHLADLRFWRMLLEGMSEVCFMEGEYVFREGERAASMFLIKTGRCEVLSEKRERPHAPPGADRRRLSGEGEGLERAESDGPGEAGAGLQQWVLQDLGNDEFDGGLPPSRRGKRILENGELEADEEEREESAAAAAAREESTKGVRGRSPAPGSRGGAAGGEDTEEWEREEDMDLRGGRGEGWFSFGAYGPGDHFGESGLVGGELRPRGASVRTRSYCNMFVVSAACVAKLRRSFPAVQQRMDAFVAECRAESARRRWRMVWVKHKGRLLRAAQVIPYPPRPWPYMVLPAEGLSRVFSTTEPGPTGGDPESEAAPRRDGEELLALSDHDGAELGSPHASEGIGRTRMLRMAL